jgi:hypothetical protein
MGFVFAMEGRARRALRLMQGHALRGPSSAPAISRNAFLTRRNALQWCSTLLTPQWAFGRLPADHAKSSASFRRCVLAVRAARELLPT